jgi:uncharacterized membrane protein (UPF0127 family)
VAYRITLGSGETVAHEVLCARGPLQRARGLLAHPPLEPGRALLLEPAAQVHTFGMRYAIDVVFCDGDWVVLRVERFLRPGRLTRWVRGARRVLELRAGSLPDSVQRGARLVVSHHAEGATW